MDRDNWAPTDTNKVTRHAFVDGRAVCNRAIRPAALFRQDGPGYPMYTREEVERMAPAVALCPRCVAKVDATTAPAAAEQAAPAIPDTYAVKGATRKMTGHYRRPGTRALYCGRPAGARNGHGATLAGWKMCTRCVKAEAADRADATATAEAWLDQPPASPLTAAALLFGAQVEAVDRQRAAEQAEAPGTWRAAWISSRAASPAPTLFDVEPEAEQGALFA